jgi:hypothetical protein
VALGPADTPRCSQRSVVTPIMTSKVQICRAMSYPTTTRNWAALRRYGWCDEISGDDHQGCAGAPHQLHL